MSYTVLPGTVVDLKRRTGTSTETTVERGVVILDGVTWLVAYLPGDQNAPADPAAADSIHVLDANCDPDWVSRIGTRLTSTAPGLFQSPAIRVWDKAIHLAQTRLDLDAALGHHSRTRNHGGSDTPAPAAPVAVHVARTTF